MSKEIPVKTPPTPQGINGKSRPKGEIHVWITSLGLAFGLAMIAALLALVTYYGTGAFWPRPIALITFEESEATRFQGSLTLAGIIRSEGERDLRDISPEEIELALDNPNLMREKEIFVGNRDAFGNTTGHFISGHISSIEFPESFMRLERPSGGTALLKPLRLEFPDGEIIQADDPSFRPVLASVVEEGRKLGREIRTIERRDIGRLSRRQSQIERDITYYSRQAELTHSEQNRLAELRLGLEETLEAQLPLQEKARTLRNQQEAVKLIYQLGTGQERSLNAGTILHYTFPNQMGLLDRVAEFSSSLFRFLTEYPREANTEGGIFPAIFGTVVMTLLMSVAVMPFGVVAAIYLREYAKQGFLVRSTRIAINNLAGVPSIVFGVFGLGFFIYFVGDAIDGFFFSRTLPTPTFGTGGILWASLTLALMTVPVVIVATEEALAAVSRGIREGSLACGASKWQTIQRLVLPASAPGILTGMILAMARGAGEVAPLILVGVVALAPSLPIDGTFPFVHLDRKFMHLGFHIYDLGFQSPDSEATKPFVFATTMILILLVIVLNLAAILLRNHLRKKYSASTF